MKWGLYLLLLVLMIGVAEAATIYGSVYDFGLEKVEEGKVVINTEPLQQMVLVNSSYSFVVEEGEYELIGYQLDNGKILAAAKEKVVVSGDGSYNLDLILFPSFEEEENILKETAEISADFGEERSLNFIIWLFLGLMTVLIGLVYLSYLKYRKYKSIVFKKKGKADLPKDLQEMFNYIKKHKRATQKEIRKEFPLSEGKVSLMISELEEKGMVKRIKKGRGNIIVLK
ncbi:helix-turn-helix transcriptional regulator [Nanoarchaeota archaeon]